VERKRIDNPRMTATGSGACFELSGSLIEPFFGKATGTVQTAVVDRLIGTAPRRLH
jgi:transcriptional regulator GlxA family with amidase domain